MFFGLRTRHRDSFFCELQKSDDYAGRRLSVWTDEINEGKAFSGEEKY